MSYYLSIIGTLDNPLFELSFGSSKQGGDGQAKFRPEALYMNQFLVHAALDLVEEVQWVSKDLYLKRIDSHQNNHIHCFLTGGNVKFMLLMNPDPQATTYSAYPTTPASRPGTAGTQAGRQSGGATGTVTGAGMLAANPNGQGTEEAVRAFMNEPGVPESGVGGGEEVFVKGGALSSGSTLAEVEYDITTPGRNPGSSGALAAALVHRPSMCSRKPWTEAQSLHSDRFGPGTHYLPLDATEAEAPQPLRSRNGRTPLKNRDPALRLRPDDARNGLGHPGRG
ncbi:TRAPP subunit [Friedmanniomyces endolithicus]|uniref:TRAPP subunit n=1 Tax=Rachicladosporium monterosium TaxID=1507873 RepID=A0ABR0LE03_9PEZI|nr:TRAPP subunit [Friedmanniomyces endolithicus]KAK5146965.1 TRAPP subunit [Rachicladosporium monterosium]KAK0860804.1 TRAPP subunit [Friedmanniomyces endolithicus]KAK0870047.1 TRAPP subunit [Friedmanniomyces endolithicus]KAK0943742.1 TRAPP subunit [Friedmanniomyces endolithicus]